MHLISLIEHSWLDTVRTVSMTCQVVELLLRVSLAPPLGATWRMLEGGWETEAPPKPEHLPVTSAYIVFLDNMPYLIKLQPHGPPLALGLNSLCSAPPRTFICSSVWQGHSFYFLCLINVLLSFHPFSWYHSLKEVPHPSPGAWFIT